MNRNYAAGTVFHTLLVVVLVAVFLPAVQADTACKGKYGHGDAYCPKSDQDMKGCCLKPKKKWKEEQRKKRIAEERAKKKAEEERKREDFARKKAEEERVRQKLASEERKRQEAEDGASRAEEERKRNGLQTKGKAGVEWIRSEPAGVELTSSPPRIVNCL